MKRVFGMLLVLVVGCGAETESPKTTVESGDTQEESVSGSDLTKMFVDPNLTTTVESRTTESSDTVLDAATVTRDEQGDVIGVSLIDSQITDAGLIYLKDLTNLQTLHLSYCENITDAGLAHHKEVPNLVDLSLYGSENITDTGLVHLEPLTLYSLELPESEKTDIGLKHYVEALDPEITKLLSLNGMLPTRGWLISRL